MEHSLQTEQEKQMLLGGMYEWKVVNASEIKEDRCSPVFKYGSNDCFLRLRYEYSSANGCRSRKLKIDLVGATLLSRINIFSKYIETCFISCNGNMHFNTRFTFLPSVYDEIVVMYWTADFMNPRFRIFNELLNEGILTFRLAWSYNIDILHSRIQQKTSSDQLKDKITTKSLEKLSKDLEAFYESKMNTDCVLTAGGEKFSVHRGLLCARSSVFAAMFHHDTSESQSGVVDILDVDAAVLKDVLHYIYTGQTRGLTQETAASTYTAADKYALMELKDDCLMFLMNNLTMDNVGVAIELVNLHGVPKLKKKISVFIKNNSKKLQSNSKWKEFTEKNPVIAVQYLHSALDADNKPQAKKIKLVA